MLSARHFFNHLKKIFETQSESESECRREIRDAYSGYDEDKCLCPCWPVAYS